MVSEKLQHLADKLGIMTEYYDAGQNRKKYEISEDVIKFFVEKLGYSAKDDAAIDRSLEAFENRRWQQALEPVYVVEQKDKIFDIVTKTEDKQTIGEIKLKSRQNGEELLGQIEWIENEDRTIHSMNYTKLKFRLTNDLAVGYYDMTVEAAGKKYTSGQACGTSGLCGR